MTLSEKTKVGILLQNVHKVYEIESTIVEALCGVNLNVTQGSIAAVIGRSGAGKSTLLHVIGTLDRPTQGSVFLNGKY